MPAGSEVTTKQAECYRSQPSRKRISLKTWSRCLIWKQNSPARCRRFTVVVELQQAQTELLSARASVIRNVRVVRLARTLTLRFILPCDLYSQNFKKFLEYRVDKLKKVFICKVVFEAVRAEFWPNLWFPYRREKKWRRHFETKDCFVHFRYYCEIVFKNILIWHNRGRWIKKNAAPGQLVRTQSVVTERQNKNATIFLDYYYI